MDAKIILKRDSADVKKPLHLKSNVFLLYAPRKIKIEPMDFQRINSGILVFIPKMQMALLHQNLERTKSMKYVPESNVYG